MRYTVTDIVWDIDCSQEEYPTELRKNNLPTSKLVDAETPDLIADALSDAHGWLVLDLKAQIEHLHTLTLMGVALLPPEELAPLEISSLNREDVEKIAWSAIEDTLNADDLPFAPRKGHRDTYALVKSLPKKGLYMYAERKLTETYRLDSFAYITCLERHTASLPLTQCAMSLEIEHEDVLRFIKI